MREDDQQRERRPPRDGRGGTPLRLVPVTSREDGQLILKLYCHTRTCSVWRFTGLGVEVGHA